MVELLVDFVWATIIIEMSPRGVSNAPLVTRLLRISCRKPDVNTLKS
jgi:hypothetical protein